MRQIQYDMAISAWQQLNGRFSHLNDFASFEEFMEEIAASEVSVKGHGAAFRITRKYPDENFGPGNLVIMEIVHERCWDRVYYPSFGGAVHE